MKKLFTILLTILISTVIFCGDVVTLNDQKSFEGKVTKIKNCIVTFKASDEKYYIPVTDIFSIQFEDINDKVYTSFMALADDDPDKCMKGQMDADMYHGKTGSHIALGVLFGPFAIIGAAVSSPTPQNGQSTYMMSKNKEFFSDPIYLSCYQKKARAKNVGNTAVGWGCWILLLLLLAGA